MRCGDASLVWLMWLIRVLGAWIESVFERAAFSQPTGEHIEPAFSSDQVMLPTHGGWTGTIRNVSSWSDPVDAAIEIQRPPVGLIARSLVRKWHHFRVDC